MALKAHNNPGNASTAGNWFARKRTAAARKAMRQHDKRSKREAALKDQEDALEEGGFSDTREGKRVKNQQARLASKGARQAHRAGKKKVRQEKKYAKKSGSTPTGLTKTT